MNGIDVALKGLSERIRQHAATIITEEAVKTSIVLPFLQSLGYDVFNPAEVIPEFTADAVGKKGEKVDYAIRLNNEVRVLVECKPLDAKLERKHLAQLFRYFTVTNARFAILTNGQLYEFYTDLDEPNKLDNKPFFTFDLLDLNSSSVTELRKFEKTTFDVDKILLNAGRLKYVSSVKRFLSAQFEEPSQELLKLIASEVYDGRITAQVRDAIGAATKIAFREIVREAVQAKLSSALETTQHIEHPDEEAPAEDIVTTQDEVEGMLTIRAIVRDVIAAERVGLRDAKTYCAVLVDNNNRKPLARLHFNRKQWYLSLFDTDEEERIAIGSLTEIYQYAERLRTRAKQLS
ncbi:type I restriction endonuclease [Sinirhodobacter huangdaonensis]|uniref:Restriction endonuclease n=1 Tax=Paenirhodobacter huangdaonensis TaxID=2501515 RepID=A0A3S3PET1_9RHOB|nr:type I restriction endonuclease [Sinirhodobacter huangdaonensis]RWR50772.1 restriction endonuclease [Sinirhodobacter huangdaonensis]